MSTGVFLSVQESYVPDAQAAARSLVAAVNERLEELGQPLLLDPVTGPHVCEGRTGLDHVGSGTPRELGELAGDALAHAHLLAVNPYRLVYAPRPFEEPQVTRHRESIAGQEVNVLLGSSHRLRDELLALASTLGIPLEGGALGDAVAKKIDDLEPLHEGDEDWGRMESLRMAWLLMHEAALLSMAKGVPISLAG